jgi:hypothetical protein
MTPGASPATHDMTGRAARRRVVLIGLVAPRVSCTGAGGRTPARLRSGGRMLPSRRSGCRGRTRTSARCCWRVRRRAGRRGLPGRPRRRSARATAPVPRPAPGRPRSRGWPTIRRWRSAVERAVREQPVSVHGLLGHLRRRVGPVGQRARQRLGAGRIEVCVARQLPTRPVPARPTATPIVAGSRGPVRHWRGSLAPCGRGRWR